MPEAGDIVSARYELVRLLGQGGMGQVWEARHIHIGNRVAIKFLNKEFAEDRQALERFSREARITGSLRHLNIVQVTDFGLTSEGIPFLVMEFLEGESLASFLEREKMLSIPTTLFIARQVLEGLKAAHAKKVVHRDLKPENIFLTEIAGHGSVAKILDFGISKIVQTESKGLRLTKTGTIVGTAYYMAPEQVTGSKDIDHRVDLWALGVMIFEMLSGRVPFEGESCNEVVVKIASKPVPDIRKILPELPSDVVRLVRKAMEKDPKKRFHTSEEFLFEIKRLSNIYRGAEKQVLATKVSMEGTGVWHGETFWRKYWKLLIPAASILVVAILTLFFVIINPFSRGEEPENVIKKPAIDSLSGHAPPQKEKEEEAGEKVKIKLLGAPEGVRTNFGGLTFEGTQIEVPRGFEQVELVVSAPGYEENRFGVIPDKDKEINIFLKKKKPAKRTKRVGKKDFKGKKRKKVGKKKSLSESLQPQEKSTEKSPREKPSGKKKKKLDFIWEIVR